jgi:hypothetical protein
VDNYLETDSLSCCDLHRFMVHILIQVVAFLSLD